MVSRLWFGGLVAKLCPTIATPWTVAHQGSRRCHVFPSENVKCMILVCVFLESFDDHCLD